MRRTKKSKLAGKSTSSVVRSGSKREHNSSVQTWEIEVIDKIKPLGGGKFKQYHCQWWGYPRSDDTWEPLESLLECDRLLESMWRAIGPIDLRGKKLIKLPDSWIESEKRFFKETYHPKPKPVLSHQPLTVVSQKQIEFYR